MILLKHVFISKYINELIFVEFMRIYGTLLKVKDQVLIPEKLLTRPSAGRPYSRPSQKSVDRAVDRYAQTCTAKGQSTARELLLSVNGPGQPLGHSPVFGRPTGRPLFLTVGNSTVGGRPGGPPTAENSVELSPTASFWSLFIEVVFNKI